MAQRKKTPEELELAAHNRLKGTICFHVSSTISQANCVLTMLNRFELTSEDTTELKTISELYESMVHIRNALNKYQSTVYVKLAIGQSPSSYKNRTPRSNYPKPKPYGTQ